MFSSRAFDGFLNVEPACSSEAHRVESENLKINSGQSTKKKKKKNKKRKNRNKGNNAGDEATETATTEKDDVAEVTKMLQQLLVSADAQVEANNYRVSILENSLRQKTSAAFSRLRDPDIPIFSKVDDVQLVCKVIGKLQGLVDEYSDARNLRMRHAIFSESLHVIHLMQRFERTNHIAITAPALAKVRETCATTLVLTKFMVSTALMGVSVGKPSQVREILDLLEKRLLAMRFHKAKALNYRALVQIYSLTRHNLGMGHASSSDTLRIFEWYLTDALTDYEALKKLDVLDGQPFYLELTIPACQDTSDFERSIEPLIGVACFGDGVKRVVYGGTKEAVASTRVLVVKLAEVAGVKLSESDSRYCVPTIRIGKFTFSTDGIIQDTAA
ncbi:hypothetical protein GN244_ATG05118 [Phytophthora infestans]|uniref:Uncharacterized protein n=1 Tax=Phytophthora infestans TaxID=4787 RepID=A0A833TGK5_PHYIN|nr:hypothetical protein GN244_ATG05118 [Phytophthora infestans]